MQSRLLLLSLCYLASASVSLVSLDARLPPSRHANLRAAKRDRDVLARGSNFAFGQQVELAYAEHYTSGSIISSHIQLEADRPTLLLEDFDHHFREVTCRESVMRVILNNEVAYNEAKIVFRSVGGILISSHHSCGDDGAHTVYR